MSEENSKEFTSDTICVQVSSKPGCQVSFEITISPEATAAAHKKAIKTISKEVSIPGFRKGKAPEATILKQFGKYVQDEWKELLIRNSYTEAMRLTDTYPIDDRSTKQPKLKEGQPGEEATLTIDFEARPDIPSVDSTKLTLTKVEPEETTEEEVAKELKEVTHHFADWSDITDRPVQEGDFVELDIFDLKTNQSLCTDTRFEVKEGEMGNWMRKLVTGRTLGEETEGTSEWEEQMEKNTTKETFTPTHCKITVKKILHASPAPLDDALAQKVGAENKEDLLKKIREKREKGHKDAAEQKMRDQLEAALQEAYPFEVPRSFVMSRKGPLLQQKLADRSQPPSKEERQQMEKEAEEEATKGCQTLLLAQKIVDENKLSIDEKKVAADAMMQMLYMSSGNVPKEQMPSHEDLRAHIRMNLLIETAEKHLISQILGSAEAPISDK